MVCEKSLTVLLEVLHEILKLHVKIIKVLWIFFIAILQGTKRCVNMLVSDIDGSDGVYDKVQ